MRGLENDKLTEKCGVVGVYSPAEQASRLTYFGLSALQHRGQESSGMVSTDEDRFYSHAKAGLVAQVYAEADLEKLPGEFAVGHNRYATNGAKHDGHLQPVLRSDDLLALAHNGNLPSTVALKTFLKEKGIYKRSSNDSEMMADAIRYYMYQGKPVSESIKLAWPLFTGAFSCVVLARDGLYAFRDGCGIRPLSLARLGDGYMIASETCAFDIVGAKHLRDISAGELVRINQKGIKQWQVVESTPKLEIFEFIYFARPDSMLGGKLVNEVRRKLGKQLATESPQQVDLVIPVPDSSIPAALGYAKELDLEFDHGLIKNRYIHRTFIEPTQAMREQAVKMKLNPLPEHLKGKSVVLIDDSIVRGTTVKKIVKMLREAGVSSVHVRISSPPIRFPDFYGIDTSDQSQLIAAEKNVTQICEYIGADSLAFLSYAGMIDSVGIAEEKLCTACFSGQYPISLQERMAEVEFNKQKLLSSAKA